MSATPATVRPMPAPSFVHLGVHTEYSLVDGTVRIDALVDALAQRAMPAVAVTDVCNLFALVKFVRGALDAGIKPIVGSELRLWNATGGSSRMTLLCQDDHGYRNLNRLLTRAYLEGQRAGKPGIERAWLTDQTEGLIALSGGHEGEVGQALLAGNAARAREALSDWQALFPDRYYLEIARTGRPGEDAYVAAVVPLASATGVPVVATNDVRFLDATDFEAHEARVCIHEGRVLSDPRRQRAYTDQQYLRSAPEMQALFADLPEALANSVIIAQRCNLSLRFGLHLLPQYPAAGDEDEHALLCRQSEAGLRTRLADAESLGPALAEPDYLARLGSELAMIGRMGFSGYFLIVADFIAWARGNAVPVGPGRGSGAGSLVAYALRITEIDPIRNDLLFERFLNPERVSLPDFDIDFCMAGRDRVIDYVAQRYGRTRVAQIITFGTMAARAVVRDVGRVLGLGYGFVDGIAKLVPFEIGMTLTKALEQAPELARRCEAEEEVRTLLDLALSLEGLARNAGRHAGGVVIAPAPLTDFMPLFCEAGGGSPVTQLDKDDVEALGLVKFDFLGLRTLTIIESTQVMLRRLDPALADFDVAKLTLDAPDAYALLKRCETTAVFQLESRGMRDLVRRLQPDCFDDVVALVALYRPGPLQSGMVDDFIARKHGRARPDYLEPRLEPVLRPTYGVILYQEQVMQIAQVLAGYSLGQADLLRRAMGKKKIEEMAAQRSAFVSGAMANGVPETRAAEIFDLMEKFAGYGFNKSHSAAYALLSYQTAWLKAHYPAQFMAAVMSADMDHTDKMVPLIEECRRMGLRVGGPDVNASAYEFSVPCPGHIVYGLGAIRGVGAGAAEAVIAVRHAGPVLDLYDFCRRVDTRKVNRRVVEALIKAGAMDALEANRAALLAALPDVLSRAERTTQDALVGQDDLFGGGAVAAVTAAPVPPCEPWTLTERLAAERETLGLYLSGHPITPYEAELGELADARLGELSRWEGRSVRVAGLVVAVRTVARTRRTTFVTLDDRTGRVDIALFESQWAECKDLVVRDNIIVIEGKVAADEFSGGWRLRAERVLTVADARVRAGAVLQVRLDSGADVGTVHALAELLAPWRGGACPVWVECGAGARGAWRLDASWSVRPEDVLPARLAAMAGVIGANYAYAPPGAAMPAVPRYAEA